MVRMHLSTLFATLCASTALALTITNDASSIAGHTFDFVVAGGGTAGLAVASRLAEVGSFSVLVIERGLNTQNFTNLYNPADIVQVFQLPNVSISIPTTPQIGFGAEATFLIGQGTGGSSQINGMMNVWGARAQYDNLGLLGNIGWDFNRFQSAIQTAERFHAPDSQQQAAGATYTSSVHGYNGLVDTGHPRPFGAGPTMNPVIQSTINAVSGLPANPDFCSGSPLGAGPFSYTINPSANENTFNNHRTTSAGAYIFPFMNQKPGLKILTEHVVDKILFSNSTHGALATGVQFVPSAGGAAQTVNVNHEVILSSGNIFNPSILMRSGIGAKAKLQSLGIPVYADLPSVGKNFRDQYLAIMEYGTTANLTAEPTAPPFAAAAYLDLTQTVGLTKALELMLEFNIVDVSNTIYNAGGFSSLPGLELLVAVEAEMVFLQNLGVVEMLYEGAPFLPGTDVVYSSVPAIQHSFSRGYVTIDTTDPRALPTVNPNAFIVDLDMTLMIQSMRISRQVFSTAPLSHTITHEVAPGLGTVPANATDQQWSNYILNGNFIPSAHGTGSCSMLPKIIGGVVDPNLLVYGTQNVRVADLSIMPWSVTGHSSRTVYAIAEIAAGIIKSANGA